ncbi:MAG TPA: asparagine synthase (glutamine-hydrolyzing) [Candidatus Acidoferrales bacterium]|nr:asparagine synthase (glutamine-hydrolyzing) [Candidatus Acidoferrales bacterium]
MCGIAGYVTTEPSSEPASILERMADSIRHRGPDDFGYYRDSWANLGFRRLAIIDVAGGHQPMTNEDGRLWLIFNGEIFNHASLRPALEAAGHRYTTRSDSETILHSYEQYGSDCVSKFRGMFAFAIWDKAARRLFLVRDRLGKKPLYYYWDGRLFAFASEIKALFEHPAISPKLEESLLPEYLAFGYASEERTLFAGIRKLMPGHHLTLDLGDPAPQPRIRQYWEIPPSAPEERADAEWIAECRGRLEETVRMRLMSDVPLGMFLSGGVDSSAIAAIMKRQFEGPVKTFAVGYREAEFSELSYARQVAQSIGTDHHEVVVSMDDFFNALPRLIWHEDEPIVWPSSVSLYFVSRLAREHVTVVLTGEGSDEMFGGYARYRHYAMNYRWLRRYRVVPAPLRRAIRRQVATTSMLSAGLRRKLQHTFVGRGEDLESLYLDNFYSAFSLTEQRRLFAGLPEASPYANFRRYWDSRPEASALARLLYSDQKTYLVELLMKQDQMSMATSIESRVPFLDHEFVEFSARVPEHMKLRHGEGKYIVKKAIEGLVPQEIIYRTKMGFPTPLRQWLMEPRSSRLFEILRAKDGLLAAYIEPAALESLLERQVSGQEDATDRVWRLLNLQLWGDLFLTGRRERHWEGLLTAVARSAV